MRNYIEEIAAFAPSDAQESEDQRTLLWYAAMFPDTVLTRENPIAHITSSGFVMNATLDKMLMIHHNIRDAWAWTGGHADGDADLLRVALREACEETGATHIRPLSERIASIDVLPVYGHTRRGRYVGAHLHLSVSYILICNESDPLREKPDENSGVRWLDVKALQTPLFSSKDCSLYGKLILRARAMR